jgi:DDE superfamily endonuclease
VGAFPDAGKRIAHVLRTNPRIWGIGHGRWRLRDLAQVFPVLESYSTSGLSRLVKRAGITSHRGRTYLHSPDPAYREKMDRIAHALALVKAHPERAVVLYGDEVSFYRQPTLADCWRHRSEEPLANLGHRANTRHRVAATLDSQTGQVTWMKAYRCTTTMLQRFLRSVRAAYPDRLLFLVWDNWPVHAHPAVMATARQLRIRILWLPTYAPWENPIEKLWRWLKQDVFHHHRFGDDWDSLKQAVDAFLDQFAGPSPSLLRYVGLLPE